MFLEIMLLILLVGAIVSVGGLIVGLITDAIRNIKLRRAQRRATRVTIPVPAPESFFGQRLGGNYGVPSADRTMEPPPQGYYYAMDPADVAAVDEIDREKDEALRSQQQEAISNRTE